MNIDKLFQVLVVGGTLLAGNAFPSEIVSEAEDLKPIFCTDEGACVPDPCTGKLVAKAGFECCWGTSCEGN